MERKGEGREENLVQQAGGPKIQKGQVTRSPKRLYYKGKSSPAPWIGEFRVGVEYVPARKAL